LLLLDEFNRAPAAAVFGNMLALLDQEKRSSEDNPGVSIARPHQGQRMSVADAFRNSTGVDVPDEVSLPASIKIVAALNSTDRSVAPLDAALRRRFAIVRVSPDLSVLARKLGTSWPRPPGELNELPADVNEWSVDHARGLAVRLLHSLNLRIESLLGEDFLLGHALLWAVTGETATEVFASLAAAFDLKVAATLRMTLADQDDALAAILRVPSDVGGNPEAPRLAEWIAPPSGLEGIASPRLRIVDAQSLGSENAAEAFRALL
jgi:5-methylcytosine-specific restriction protein B